MKKSYLISVLFLCFISKPILFAQPSNDECVDAIELTNLNNWCSSVAEYSTANATLSPQASPFCFPNEAHDIWFSFVAAAADINIAVIGNTTGNPGPGGTLNSPQFALYNGSCNGTLTEEQCASDNFGDNIAESFHGPLTVGQTYYIRIDARNGNSGTFQLCINNFNQIPDPSSDCPTGVVLCDKSSFTVENLESAGNDPNELIGVSCIQQEFSSAWYIWECKDAGSLSFTLTPTKPADDLDFAVFELPGGVGDCSNKVELRCCSSGEVVGQPFPVWEPCTGATGLALSSTDNPEFPGCDPGDDNFVSSINMEVGKFYALAVVNFSNSGNGFSIEFGGTGTFQGPTADFESSANNAVICLNESITFTDASTSINGIDEWEWSFGVGANPATASGAGPHDVTYSSPGVKSIVLNITSNAGCIVTQIETIVVQPLPEVSVETHKDYCGPTVATGRIALTPAGGVEPFLYEWNNSGSFTSVNEQSNLTFGFYSVVVMDANGCEIELDIEVEEGLELDAAVDPFIPPTCNGDSDGSISISVEFGEEVIMYDFGGGLQNSNTLTGIPAGTYDVFVVDANGCEGDFTIVVDEFPPLVVEIASENISCFGENDGTAIVTASGGTGTYTYQWDNFSTNDQIVGLSENTYTVTVTDTQGCTEEISASIVEPPELFLDLGDVIDVLCHGDETGAVSVIASGGTPPFMYSVEGGAPQESPDLIGLGAGTYTIIAIDSEGCTVSIDAVLNEPPPISVDAGPDQTIDLGFTADLAALVNPPFHSVTYQWLPFETLDCEDCPRPTALPLGTTTYQITIIDETECVATDEVTIHVVLNRPVYIPNVFSPNGDGLNDRFTIYGGPAVSQVRDLKIFSRWGSLVFEASNFQVNDESLGWDGTFKGKKMDPAVFAYLAEIEFIDGEVLLFEGDVTILR